MQVADNTQLVSSATLGGAQEVIDFGISDDPAFFQILSSNLYSNQKLAVVREVLCNSWDAHIDANITDRAVEVTYKDGVLNFRDFGKGIAHEDMGRVYGTYGASTKKNDSKSTGGFGLGCKAPFAYTDSFRVTSCHMGIKTLYNISKSSVESKGKPSIVKILAMPTTESGLTVSIAIEPKDWREFSGYLNSITMLGEIKATLETDSIVKTEYRRLDMPFTPGVYTSDSDSGWFDYYMGNHRVFIRYGNVVYPVLNTPATKAAVNTIERFLDILSLNRVLVQAAPDSLALTPGRESLSSQKKTENGIVDVVTDLVARMEADVKKAIPKTMSDMLNKFPTYGRHVSLIQPYDWFSHFSGIVGNYLRSPFGEKYRKHYQTQMLKVEVDVVVKNSGFKESKLESVFRNAVFKAKKTESYLPYIRMYRKYFLKPLMRTVANNKPVLDIKHLRIQFGGGYGNLQNKNFFDPKRMTMDQTSVWHQGDKLIFASTAIRDIEESIHCYPAFQSKAGGGKYNASCRYGDIPIYRLSANAAKRKDELAALKASDYTVVDLTQNYEWDPRVKEKVIKEKSTVGKLAVTNSLYSLRSLLGEYTDYVGKGHLTRAVQRNGFRVPDSNQYLPYESEPEFYVELTDIRKLQLGRFFDYHGKHDPILDKGVFVTNGIERRMAIKRGAVHIDKYLFKPIMDTYLSKEMLEYMSKYRLKGLENFHIADGLIDLCKTVGCMPKAADKLYTDQNLETCIETIQPLSLTSMFNAGHITQDELTKLQEREMLALKEYAWVKKLKVVSRDAVMQEFNFEDLNELIKKYPERKAAFRSLILIAMKNGK
jgi:hypothetical protein